MNPIRKLHLYSLVLILTVLFSRTPPATAITLDELADICRTMESAFTDISVEYEWGFEPAPSLQDMPVQDILIQKGLAKKKWSSKHPFTEIFLTTEQATLANPNGASFDSTTMSSCDGETTRHLTIGGLSSTGEQANISDGSITKSPRSKPILNSTPIAFSILRLGLDHEKIPLSKRLLNSEFVRLSDNIEKVNGFNTVCAEFLWDAPNVPILHKKEPQLRIYFSVDHGYTPIKFDNLSHTKSGSKVNFSVNVTSLEKVSDNIWFPSEGSLAQNPTNTYRASKIVINQGLKDEDFRIEFPPGTRIFNEISGLSYVSESLDDQAGTSTNSTLKDSEPAINARSSQPPADTPESNKTLIYVSIASFVVLLIALVAKKYI